MSLETGEPRKVKKHPGYLTEVSFMIFLLFFLKIHSDIAFTAFTFMTVLLPLLVYLVASIVMDIVKFIQQLHLENIEEEDGFLTAKQVKLLFRIVRDLLAYFGTYCLAQLLDKHIAQKELAVVQTDMVAAFVALQLAFLIKMVDNY